MLYVVTNKHERTWHYGEPKPKINDDETVLEVQADNDELEHIREKFPLVPYPKNNSVVRWFGDMAKFIAHNL